LWEVLSAIACGILILISLVGTILPVLPGIPLAWVGLFIYALGSGFQKISVTAVVVFFVVTAATMALAYFAPSLGAKKYKASRAGIIGSFLGLFIGVIVLNVWGIILGPFFGALIGELLANRPASYAFRSAAGTLIGFLAGTLVQIIVILIMAGFFIAALF